MNLSRGSEEEDDEREDGQDDMFLDFLLGQGESFYLFFFIIFFVDFLSNKKARP